MPDERAKEPVSVRAVLNGGLTRGKPVHRLVFDPNTEFHYRIESSRLADPFEVDAFDPSPILWDVIGSARGEREIKMLFFVITQAWAFERLEATLQELFSPLKVTAD